MSQENVDLVLGLYPAPDVDLVPLYRDDTQWAEQAEALAPFIHADFDCVRDDFGSERRYAGLDGLRAFMLDWMSPWVAYRIEIEEAIDLGERVLLLNHDRGRREGSTQEVRGRLAAVFTIRDGKIARLDTYMTRADALRAVGLSEQDAHADS
jgi:ketosteroid isomerase-like protein